MSDDLLAAPLPSNVRCGLSTLAILYRQPEAAIVLATLRAHGITALARDGGIATVAPHWTVLLGGIAILVPTPDLDRAATILAEIGAMPPPPRNLSCRRMLDILLHSMIVVVLFASGGAYFPMPPRARGAYAKASGTL